MKKLLLRFRPVALLALAAASILLISGCTSYFPRNRAHQSGSVVSFLFPKEQPRVQTPVLPVLDLPLRVGIAFVPETQTSRASFSEMQKQRLLGRVADKFRTLPFVQAIEVVPAAYLRPGGGFENLDQLRSLLGIDVIVLLSYDQVQFTDHNVLSLAYWTIVGAYVFTGDHNDTQTLMEATVYDIASRSFLFRAPGVDRTKGLGALAYSARTVPADGEGRPHQREDHSQARLHRRRPRPADRESHAHRGDRGGLSLRPQTPPRPASCYQSNTAPRPLNTRGRSLIRSRVAHTNPASVAPRACSGNAPETSPSLYQRARRSRGVCPRVAGHHERAAI
jgi:rhombotail lipoprotein